MYKMRIKKRGKCRITPADEGVSRPPRTTSAMHAWGEIHSENGSQCGGHPSRSVVEPRSHYPLEPQDGNGTNLLEHQAHSYRKVEGANNSNRLFDLSEVEVKAQLSEYDAALLLRHDYLPESNPLQCCCYMEGGALVCTSPPIKNTSTCEKHRHTEKSVKTWIDHQKQLRSQIACIYDRNPSPLSSACIAHGTNDGYCSSPFATKSCTHLPAAPPIGRRSQTSPTSIPPKRSLFKVVEL